MVSEIEPSLESGMPLPPPSCTVNVTTGGVPAAPPVTFVKFTIKPDNRLDSVGIT